ncbi:MAG: site-specific integrase [Deltaproteobacteria bacterium]|nr:site-specific integrase [Deltaproteobacteria bacterium]
MSVNKTKDGRWRATWRDPNQGGRVVSEYFGHGLADKQAAAERDLEIKLEKKRRPVQPRDIGVLTFEELAQTYINARHVELSPKTVAEILRTAARYALPVIGSKPITRISMAHWSEIEKAMIARNVTARTINKYFQYFSRMFGWAVERDYLKDSPWARRKPLRIKNRFQVELLTHEEFQKIIQAADDHLRWALEVELNTGVRPGPTELFTLRWDDFDYETGAVRIYSSKTDSYHTQYVAGEFLERLKEQRARIRAEDIRLAKRRGEIRPECPYVISFRGEPVRQLAKAWKAAKTEAGITRRIRLYDIRHYFITHALASGADILDLAHRVGHKNANMIVNVYSHLVTEMQTKKPLSLPKHNFKKASPEASAPNLLVKSVGQKEKGLQGVEANNL